MASSITPTFFLKGIDPNEIYTKYREGFFNRPLSTVVSLLSKIKIASNAAIIAPTYGKSNNDPIFCVKDRFNSPIIIATAGHESYNVYNRTGGEPLMGGVCRFCSERFEGPQIGYPIAHQEQSILTNIEGEKPVYRVINNFWTQGCFCSFQCALAKVRQNLNLPADYRDSGLRDSERLLKFLYKLTYPNAKVLRPAQDLDLLIEHGGSLSRKEWEDEKHVFRKTDRVLVMPVKTEYIQRNI
jgi:hypothetical protein